MVTLALLRIGFEPESRCHNEDTGRCRRRRDSGQVDEIEDGLYLILTQMNNSEGLDVIPGSIAIERMKPKQAKSTEVK